MTTKAKKILVTTESREMWVVRRGVAKSQRGYCPQCATDVQLLPLDAAVSISGKSTRELLYQTELGAVHVIEAASGHLLVCQNTLKARLPEAGGTV